MLKTASVPLLLLTLLLPNFAFAQSVTTSAYFTMGSGLLVLIGLATYVIRQLLYVIRHYKQKPAK